MKSELRKRKKRFWALCLALALTLVNVIPMGVLAAETYDFYGGLWSWGNPGGVKTLKPGDVINNSDCSFEIRYYDDDGEAGEGNDEPILLGRFPGDYDTDFYGWTHTVKSYSEVGSNRRIPEEQFKEWEIIEHVSGSGGIKYLSLKAVKYTISNIIYYNVEDAINNNPLTYYEGTGVASLAAASKTGYTFGGWYTDEACTEANKVTSILSTQTGNVDLYAKFTANDYNIEYELNGGTNGNNPTGYTYGTGVSSFADASREGYTFGGWYTDEACTEANKVTSISAIQTGDVKLYAKFTVNNYDIEYELNGGTNGNNPTSYTYGIGVASLADASKTGYTFGGWYSDATYTTRVTSISTTQTDIVKLYAKFTVNDYDITYELNGGTNGSNPTSYTYGTGVASLEAASKTGYTFGGWYTDEACTEANKVTSISSDQTGDVKLYAKFTANNYDITYDLNGGTNGNNPTSYTYGIGVASLADASKTGYTFGGWYSDATYTTKVTSISTTQTDIVKLYAKFTVNDYDITYDLNGGTNGNNPTSYTYGTGVASLADASRVGYTFGGWYTDEACTEANKVTSISATQTGDVKLYAKFRVNIYNISYELNGGINGNNPTSYTYGIGVASLADASKTGYTFGGWFTNVNFVQDSKVTSISATQTEDVKLYAKFTVNNYGIEYELNGGTNGSNPTGYTYGTGVASLADASKTGYTFGGWYTDEACTEANKVTSISATQTGDVKLYAKFTVNSYGIEYELNGGTNGNNPTSYTYGTGVARLEAASKTGYTFEGWYIDEACTEANKVTSISTDQTGNVKLYAKFTVNSYGIIYELNGGTNGSNPTSYTYGTGVARLEAASKTGYTFGGWYTDEACTEANKVTSIPATHTGDVKLYAKFSFDWDSIRRKTENAKNGDTITIDMNGETLVPGDVFNDIKGKDITIILDMGDGISWTINGKDITSDNVGDIDFGVEIGTNTIPVEIINKVFGERYTMQLSLAYEGEFGLTAVLSFKLDSKNAGLYANLFYYIENSGELEFICADEIDADGTVRLTFTHASDYAIVIDRKPLDGSLDTDTEQNTDNSGDDDTQKAPATGDDVWNPLWVVVIGAMIIVFGQGIFFATKKKSSEE